MNAAGRQRQTLIFAGTPELAARALQALLDAGHPVALVLTQPDRPAGRGMKLQPSPVKQFALDHGIAVAQPRSLRLDGKYPEDAAAARAAILSARADAMVVAAYGLILPPEILAAPSRGCLNIHASLLPRWRGAAPIQAALRAGDAETGITIMQMEAGLDTGPMLMRESVPIEARTTAPDLHDALATLGARLILRVLREWPPPVPQPAAGVTYAAKLTREDGRIDWQQGADEIDRQVRALNPWPGTFCRLGSETLKVLAAEQAPGSGAPGTILDGSFTVACGSGALRVLRAQRPGRPAMAGDALLRGITTWRETRLS